MSNTYKEKADDKKNEAKQFFRNDIKNRFAERLEEAMAGEANLSFAQKCGISEATIRKYKKGETTPNLEILDAIATAANVDLTWLATGNTIENPPEVFINKPINEDSIEIVQYDFKASAGTGCLVVSENPVAKFEFSKEWLIKQSLHGKHLTIVPVFGDSMESTLMDEDLMLVEVIEDPQQLNDGIYVFRIDESILVKRLQYDFAMRGYHATSDNSAYQPFFIGEEFKGRFQILGRMVRVLQRAKK